MLLPNGDETVMELLCRWFPRRSCRRLTRALSGSEFVAEAQPSECDADDLRISPYPDFSLLCDIAEYALVTAGMKANGLSIVCPHLADCLHCYPLWILSLWLEIEELRMRHLKPWRTAVAVLKQPNGSALDADILGSLAKIRYSSKIKGCDKDMTPVSSLAIYPTQEWLGSTHEVQMLETLRRSLQMENIVHFETADCVFFETLLRLRRSTTVKAYLTSKHTAWMRRLGEKVSQKLMWRIGGTVNVRGCHWVAVVINFEDNLVLYGDSMGHSPPVPLVRAILWWIRIHTNKRFRWDNLSITRQTDGHSCGLLAFNAVAHNFIPHRYPLIRMCDVHQARLSMMMDVINIHLSS